MISGAECKVESAAIYGYHASLHCSCRVRFLLFSPVCTALYLSQPHTHYTQIQASLRLYKFPASCLGVARTQSVKCSSAVSPTSLLLLALERMRRRIRLHASQRIMQGLRKLPQRQQLPTEVKGTCLLFSNVASLQIHDCRLFACFFLLYISHVCKSVLVVWLSSVISYKCLPTYIYIFFLLWMIGVTCHHQLLSTAFYNNMTDP